MNKQNVKGITLIALVITIIVLLILASVSVATLFGNQGIIENARKAKFMTDIAAYKEQLQLKEIGEETFQTNTIFDLEDDLKKQIESFEMAIENINNAIELMQKASQSLYEIGQMCTRIEELMVNICNPGEADVQIMQQEIEQLIIEIDKSLEEAEYGGKKLFDGTYNQNHPYIVELGNGTFDQPEMKIVLENLNWKGLYGNETINYNNPEIELEKISKANQKISYFLNELGAKVNVLDFYNDDYFTICKENVKNLYESIFSNSEKENEQEIIKKANSWNTTAQLLQYAQQACSTISEILMRIQELTNSSIEESVQTEIEHEITLIDELFKYTAIGEKKIFDGTFPYIEAMNISKLEIREISIIKNQKDAQAKVDNAIKMMEDIRSQLSENYDNIEDNLTEPPDDSYTFGVTTEVEILDNIGEEYKNKLKIINGKLVYIGNDKKEIEWSKQMGIGIKGETP